uniref:acyltransferase domain-containing protein n=1 Tax=Streptomyces flavofungini TaxID=68200 RepID=UPI0034DF36E7
APPRGASAADWSPGTVALLTTARPWPTGTRPRRAGVSGFGASGTNAHLIIEEPPDAEVPFADAPQTSGRAPGDAPDPAPVVWPLSGKGPGGLAAQARRLHGWVTARPESSVADIGWALATTRAPLSHRAVVVGGDRDGLLDRLARLASPEDGREAAEGGIRPGKVAFVFPGQGSQWAGMAAELLASAPVFAHRVEECAKALAPHLGYDLLAVLNDEPGAPSLDRVDVVQPVLFSVMVSLAALWRSYGVRPDAVVGHSQGEMAAACVAGALSLDDAARVVALRSRAIATLGTGGGMLSVAEPAADVRARIAALPGPAADLCVAVVNSPSSVVVSGPADALTELSEDCAAEGVWARRVPVDYASHSPQMEELEPELRAALGPVRPRSAPDTAFYSTVTAERTDTTALDAGYWYTNLRGPVLFEDTVRAMADAGYRTFIEVSPHPVVTTPISHTLESAAPGPGTTVIGTLKRDHGGPADFLDSVGEAYVGGVDVDWRAAFAGRDARRVELPRYAFTRRRFWVDHPADDAGAAAAASVRHPVLSGQLSLAGSLGHVFTGRLSPTRHPWLADHTVFGEVVVPGTALVELAATAGRRLGLPTVEELTLEAPLLIRADEVSVQLQAAETDARGRAAFTLHAEDGAGGWTRHASGVLGGPGVERGTTARSADSPGEEAQAGEPVVWPPAGAVPVGIGDLYGRLAARGMEYGGMFRGLRRVWRHGAELCADVAVDATDGFDPRHLLHPALLDAAFHAAFAAGPDGDGAALLPFAWTGVRLTPGERAPRELRVRLTPTGQDTVRLTAADTDGRTVATVASVVARPVTESQLSAARPVTADCLFGVDWQRAAPGVAPGAA